MADWSTPSLTTGYAAYLAALKDRDVDIATMFNNGTPTNTPTNAIKLDAGSIVCTFRKWNGSAWVDAVTQFWAPHIYTAGNLVGGAYLGTGYGVSTADCRIEIGGERTANGYAYLDLHATPSTDYEARIIRASGANGAFQILNSGTGALSIVQEGAAPIVAYIGGSERMRVESNGYVGIGHSSPDFQIDVGGQGIVQVRAGSGSTPYFQSYNYSAAPGAKYWRHGNNSGNYKFELVNDAYSSATEMLSIDATGQMFQTVTGDLSLRAQRSAGSNYLYHDFWTGGVRRGFIGAHPSNDFFIYSDANLTVGGAGVVVFNPGGTERARLTSTGLGIGTSTPAHPLDVNGAVRSQSTGFIFPDGTTQATAAVTGVGGGGQTFSAPFRTYNTSYQNTTGKPIMVMGRFDNGASGAYFQVSNDNSSWLTTTDGSSYGQFSAVIPNGAYYRISAASGCTIYSWVELS